MNQVGNTAGDGHLAQAREAGLAMALAVTGTAQGLATFAVYSLPVLVALAAPDFGLPIAMIGYQVALLYVFAALSSGFGGPLLRRVGPVRTTQIALLCAALGVEMLALAHWIWALPASALLGAAYGLTNPAAAQLLGRLAPASRRNLVFSVKQMGVPLGLALAGLVLPPLAQSIGWQMAMLAGAAVLTLLAVGVQPLRAGWDRPQAEAGGAPAATFAWRDAPALRLLAITGASFGVVQIALGAHMMAMLVLDFGWDLVSAGLLVALCQTVGAFSRIGWAVLADGWSSGLKVLGLIGVLTAAFLLLLPLAPSAGVLLIGLLFALLGGTAAGWNGVLVAESVRLAPPGAAGAASGAVLSLTFVGAVVGPTAIALMSTALGGYVWAFALSAALPLIGGAVALRARRLVG